MTAISPSHPSGQAQPSFRHELYPYRGDAQFLSGTLGYIHEALEGDEAVVVAVPRTRRHSCAANSPTSPPSLSSTPRRSDPTPAGSSAPGWTG